MINIICCIGDNWDFKKKIMSWYKGHYLSLLLFIDLDIENRMKESHKGETSRSRVIDNLF